MDTMRERIARVMEWFVGAFFFLIIGYLTILVFLYKFDSSTSVEIKANIIPNLCAALVIILISILRPKREVFFLTKYGCWIITVVAVLFVVVWGFIYTGQLRILPGSDPAACFLLAKWFLECNYSAVIPTDSYLSLWPFQTGFIFILEKMMRIFNTTDPLFFQRVNVVYYCIMMVAGVGIIRQFTKRIIPVATYLAIMCTYCGLMFNVYEIYGDLPAMSLMVCAYYIYLRLIKEESRWLIVVWGLVFVFLCGLGGAYKGQTKIFAIAILLASLVTFIKERKCFVFFAALLGLFAAVAAPKITQGYYEYYAKNTCGPGVPASAYLAMGLQKGSEEAIPGGWNGFHSSLYMETGYDYDLTDSISKEEIKESWDSFVNNPIMAVDFFHKKILRTWANETHGAFWAINDLFDTARSADAYWVRFAEDHYYDRWLDFIDCHETAVYCLLFLFALVVIRELWIYKRVDDMVLGSIIFLIGGYLFSLVWEGQTDAVMYYTILLFPIALGKVWKM